MLLQRNPSLPTVDQRVSFARALDQRVSFARALKDVRVEERVNLLVHRPLAFELVRRVVDVPSVTPNRITLMGLAVGLTAAAVAWQAGVSAELWPLAAALLFVSVILDCADGMLARLRGTSTPLGMLLDGAADHAVGFAVWAGLAHAISLHLSATGALCVFVLLSTLAHCALYDRMKIQFEGADPTASRTGPLVAVHRSLGRVFAGLLGEPQMHEQRVLEPAMRDATWLGLGTHLACIYLTMLVAPFAPSALLWLPFFGIGVFGNVWMCVVIVRFRRARARARATHEPRDGDVIGVIVVPSGFDPRTPIAGLAPLERHMRALRAAGIQRIHIAGPVPVGLRKHALQEAFPDARAIVVLADVTCHRLLPLRLMRVAVGANEALEVAGDGASLFVAGVGRTRGLVLSLTSSRRVTRTKRLPLEGNEFVVRASSLGEREHATELHLASLAKATAGPLDRAFMRGLSRRITRRLVATAVTPNAVTVFSLAVALLSAYAVAQASSVWVAVGALLLVAVRILDCVDGEIARVRHEQSQLGEWLDTVSDGIGIGAFVAGVAWHESAVDPRFWPLGLVGVAAWLAVQLTAYAVLLRGGRGSLQLVEWPHRRANPTTLSAKMARSAEGLFRIDVISVAYAMLAVIGRGDWLLLIHCVMSVVALGYFAQQVRRGAVQVRADVVQ